MFYINLIHRQMVRELVPSDLHKIQGSSDWKRSIVAAYNQDAGMSPEDAKITFLKIVYRFVFFCNSYTRYRSPSIRMIKRLLLDGQHLVRHFSKSSKPQSPIIPKCYSSQSISTVLVLFIHKQR